MWRQLVWSHPPTPSPVQLSPNHPHMSSSLCHSSFFSFLVHPLSLVSAPLCPRTGNLPEATLQRMTHPPRHHQLLMVLSEGRASWGARLFLRGFSVAWSYAGNHSWCVNECEDRVTCVRCYLMAFYHPPALTFFLLFSHDPWALGDGGGDLIYMLHLWARIQSVTYSQHLEPLGPVLTAIYCKRKIPGRRLRVVPIYVYKYSFKKGSLTTWPLNKTIVISLPRALISSGIDLETRFTILGINSLLWSRSHFKPICKVVDYPIIIMTLLYQWTHFARKVDISNFEIYLSVDTWESLYLYFVPK